jgi:phage pi2 protein 07
MILQLDPPIPVVTPHGKAMAHVLIDYGPEYDLVWVCFQDKTGHCWSFNNKDITAQTNITFNRIIKGKK